MKTINNRARGIEHIRQSFKPKSIRTLFVGESAPASGAFFYNGDSQMYRYMKRAFGDRPNFLDWLRNSGRYLDDLVLTSINYQTNVERRAAHLASLPGFVERLRDYSPLCVVTLLLKIKDPINEAIQRAGLAIPHYPVPFPGNGQQRKFLSEMEKIIPGLP